MKKTLVYTLSILLCTLVSCESLSTKDVQNIQREQKNPKGMVKVCTRRPNGSTCSYVREEELRRMLRTMTTKPTIRRAL